MKSAADERRSSSERQAELTDAALSIVATRGIAALTTRTLAAEVGLTSGAIFRHFKSLDALLDAVVGRVESVLLATYPSPSLAPAERLSAFLEARSQAVGSQLGILRLVVSEQFSLALPEGGSARLSRCIEKTRAFVTKCLREGQAQGVFRDDLEPQALALIVMGALQMLALSNAPERARALEATNLIDALLSLLRKPAPLPSPPPSNASKSRKNSR